VSDDKEYMDSMPPTIKNTPPPPTNTASLVAPPTVPNLHTGTPVRSCVSVRPTNKAPQLKSELWTAQLEHCIEDQLSALATHADSLPNSFKFHPFHNIEWKEQARIQKQAACCVSQKVDDIGVHFYMDFGFMHASISDYGRPDVKCNKVVESYDGYSSYLLIIDDKSSKTWVFLTRTKEPPIEIVHLFLQSFGCNKSLSGFIYCNQGGELAHSHVFVDMTLADFNYKVKPTGANSPTQNGQAKKWIDTFGVTTRALLYGAGLSAKYWLAALLHVAYFLNRHFHSCTGITLFEGWWGVKPNLEYLKLFGSRVCIKHSGNYPSKLDKHNFSGIFLGYTSTDQNIRHLNINSGAIKTSHYATFDEAWYLHDSCPPEALLLHTLGLDNKTTSTTCAPPQPVDVAKYPSILPTTAHFPLTVSARMTHLPLCLSLEPIQSLPIVKTAKRIKFIDQLRNTPWNDTGKSQLYGITSNNVAQVYMSPSLYNSTFVEELNM
jgi:hypothetical protein